ncbi:hypothetical protein BpHYR1_036923 [Brachionus plicatilis]|uniref:Uncharacterized protein n=1 Tax=Brachionus plicatilis TaxID=10195 RepID=A0A3M7RWZ2_BRAPC|nr:hypothetical protein BpHYR1_036923 [Brachionus plicatilis]
MLGIIQPLYRHSTLLFSIFYPENNCVIKFQMLTCLSIEFKLNNKKKLANLLCFISKNLYTLGLPNANRFAIYQNFAAILE